MEVGLQAISFSYTGIWELDIFRVYTHTHTHTHTHTRTLTHSLTHTIYPQPGAVTENLTQFLLTIIRIVRVCLLSKHGKFTP